MNQSNLLKQLNSQQREAVEQTGGPLLVLAGAGSGKTRVLTHRLAYIIEKGFAQPHQILAVTFTNKAANEMKQRVEKILQIPIHHLWIGTFHSISARILHREAHHIGYQSNFTIYDVEDQENLIKRIMLSLNINKESVSPPLVKSRISDAKNKLKDAKVFEKEAHDFRSQLISRIFIEYERTLLRNNAMDFDDLILKPIEIFTLHPNVLKQYQKKFKYILIDEYQDTNKAQYYWIKLLAKEHRNLCVVGDEDQSIYRWRGADVGNILNFEKDYPDSKVIRLEQNYRSTQTILDAANSVIKNNKNRLGKNLWSEKSTGQSVVVHHTQDEISEGYMITNIINDSITNNGYSLKDIVILYRTNVQSRAIEEQLRRQAIPYTIVGGIKFYERKEVKDILAYLKVLVNPSDSVSLQRIVNFPPRSIGDTTQKVLLEYSRENNLTLYQTMEKVGDIDSLNSGTIKRICNLYNQLEECRKKISKFNAYQITENIIRDFGLKDIYEKSDQIEDEARLENVTELLNSVEIFVQNNSENSNLENYLEEVTLLTDIDRWDPDKPSVTLMTLHSAKGLEFPIVVVSGVEDGLIPLSKNYDDPEDLEEERRLFYVGMTRAKRRLYLLHSQTRHRFGRGDFGGSFLSMPSRFLKEIPENLLEIHSSVKPGLYEPKRLHKAEKYRKRLTEPFLEKLPDEDSEYKIGQYVKHDVFGRGQILGVDFSNLGTKLTIQFENKTIKKLIAEYANLLVNESLE